jgi:multiple sugar transport system permease protein
MKKLLIYAVLILFAALFLAPFYWMFSTAVKPADEVFLWPPKWIPSRFMWENFSVAWGTYEFNSYLKNSLIVTSLSTIGAIVSSSLVAYGFARYQFRGRNLLFVVLLSTMMIHWDVTMIPLYMEYKYFGWINTLKPLFVSAWFGLPFFIFLLRQFIMTLPKELDESAKIDGANTMQIFIMVIAPLMIPALIVVGVFQFLNSWNDYLGPLIFLNDMSKYTLTLGLAQFRGLNDVDMASIMAITSIICLPPILIFFFSQKYIVDGIATTGMKG